MVNATNWFNLVHTFSFTNPTNRNAQMLRPENLEAMASICPPQFSTVEMSDQESPKQGVYNV